MNARYCIPSKKEMYDMYVIKDKTIKEISDELKISVGKIHNLLKKYEIEPKTRKTNKKWCKKLSESKKGKIPYNKGKKMSEEQKEKLSIKKSGGIGKKVKTTTGYIKIYFPDHPKSDKRGFILEHILIMECNIGRHLRKNEVVHHKNKIKTDNRIKNLQLMTRSEHMKLHRKERNDDISTL